jgi:hypothetical protein
MVGRATTVPSYAFRGIPSFFQTSRIRPFQEGLLIAEAELELNSLLSGEPPDPYSGLVSFQKPDLEHL